MLDPRTEFTHLSNGQFGRYSLAKLNLEIAVSEYKPSRFGIACEAGPIGSGIALGEAEPIPWFGIAVSEYDQLRSGSLAKLNR